MSNEIITRCRASISISEIFDGDVKGEEAHLQQSVAACEAWLVLYSKTQTAVEREREAAGHEGWNLDMSSIFAQLNAFVQVRPGARAGARVWGKVRVEPPTRTPTPHPSPHPHPSRHPHPRPDPDPDPDPDPGPITYH